MIRPLFLTISEQIADEIRKSIILGDLTEGTPLREIELSKSYSVSRGPVRDALKELAKEGFLEMIPNVGVKVASKPSEDALTLIIKMRKDIESYAIERVYNTFSEEEISEMEELMDRYMYACNTDNIHDIISLDMSFHKVLVDKVEDAHISDLWQSVVNRMLFRYARHENLMESYEEHIKMLEALRNKDKDLLLELMDRNIQ